MTSPRIDAQSQSESLPEVMANQFLCLLRCPHSGESLREEKGELVSAISGHRYRSDENGIFLFAETPVSEDARIQQTHYDEISTAYITNLHYPHTQEYIEYLDDSLNSITSSQPLGVAAEICCGSGEAFSLYHRQIEGGIGVDISTRMLAAAKNKFQAPNLVFVQGDATALPLEDAVFDTVFMLGGIHHVGDRDALFREVARILKPGGRFIWREPVSDFWLWRVLRWIVYRVSPILDHTTERPLRYSETAPYLEAANLSLEHWKTIGFVGFCLFMNSDVLYFNRLFRFVPGIRFITRMFAKLDDAVSRLPGMSKAGLIVVGQARKR